MSIPQPTILLVPRWDKYFVRDAKDEVTITPLKKHFPLLFLLRVSWQKPPFLWFADTKGVLLCFIRRLLHAFWLFYLDWEQWLRGVNLLLRLVCSKVQDLQRRECNRGKKTVFLLCCLCSSEHRELSDIENYTSTSKVLQESKNESNVPKLFPVEQLHKWDSY